ncbi:hypothetical protein OIE78_34375 (plasmid) [Streptomyces cellulosae]|uniref:hypothetical protein n=1 Tax=Streptomyces cellulosae TaxID=1968 RepID=UPI002F91837C|nr:hypothetical protein OG837_35840 [Streptomyces cellulosae]
MKPPRRPRLSRRALRFWLIAIPLALFLALAGTVAFADPEPNPAPGTAPAAPGSTPSPAPGTGGSTDKPSDDETFDPMEPRPGATPGANPENKPVEDLSKTPKDASDGLLQPFNVRDEYGVPISAYSVDADTGDWNDIDLKLWNILAQLFFGVCKWFVGFSCWLVDWALGFGLAKIMVGPADDIATTLRDQVINRLGLPGLFLVFAFAYGAWHILFKQRSRGFAEAGMSLVVAAVATTVLMSPAQVLLGTHDQPSPGGSTMLLSEDGLLGKTRDFSLEVSALILSNDPDGQTTSKEVSRPITNALVDAFIVKPTQLMLYGKTFEGECAEAFAQASLIKYNYEQRGLDFFEANQQNPTGGATYLDQLLNSGEHFKKVCKVKEGDAKKASADQTFSAAFVALAAVIVSILMVLVTGGFLVSQGWVAFEGIRGHWALAAGILPGGGRAVLWRWFSAIAKAILGVALAILFLGVFIVVILALIDADTGKVLAVKFITIDIAAVAGLVGQKKIKETARQVAVNLNRRLANARVGGSRQSVFNSFGRYAETAPGLKQLFGEAKGEARKVSRPLAQAGRSAKQMWVGPPQNRRRGGRVRAAARLATNAAAAVGTGGASAAAKVAAQGAAKQALRKRLATAAANKMSQTRGGRATMATGKVAAATAKYGWKATKFTALATVGAPVGIPRGVAAAKRGGAAAAARANEVKQQLTAAKDRAASRVGQKVDGAKAFATEYRRNVATASRFVARSSANAQLGFAATFGTAQTTSTPGPTTAATAPRTPGAPPAAGPASPPATGSKPPSPPSGAAAAVAAAATTPPKKKDDDAPPAPAARVRTVRRATRPAGPPRRSS